MTDEFAPEMRLFDAQGRRLYLDADELERFLAAAAHEDREDRIFCHLLHYTGCRPSEALEVTAERVLIKELAIVFRSLKKRKLDAKGKKKQPTYRTVPVPDRLIEELDLVFDLRARARRRRDMDTPLWPMSRATAWRMVQRVMERAGITGPQATAKGLRHGYGILMIHSVPITVVRDLLGHTDTKTTEIYLQAVGPEKRNMVMQAWRRYGNE